LVAEVAPETAGDPMSLQKWTRSSLRRLSQRLRARGLRVSAPTVGRLLTKHRYALRVNRKTKESGQGHPERDTQFAYIETRKAACRTEGVPLISVDTKSAPFNGRRCCSEEPHMSNGVTGEQRASGRGTT